MKKILIVEDEAIIAMTEVSMLKKYGYDATAVYTPDSAIKKIEEESVDLILMDIDLGKDVMDGVDTAKIILEKCDIPVVFLSSHTEPEIVKRTEKVTSYGYIVKNSGETVIDASIKMAFKLHNAYKKLEQEEEDYRITLESVGDAIVSTDNIGTITKVNKTAEELIGYNDLIGQNIHEVFKIVNAQTREVVENPIQKVIKTGKVEGLANHTVLISKDGTEYQIADSAAPIINDDGEILGVILVFRDVTEQYKKEEKIRKSEKFLQNTFDAIQDGVTVLDQNLNVVKVNDWIKQDFDSIKGRKCYEVFQTRESPCQHCPTLKTFKDGEPHKMEMYVPTAKEHSWIELNSYPVFDDNGNVEFVIEYRKDVTDRKKSEENIKQSERKYRELIDFSPIGIFQTHSDGHVLFANPAMYEMVGTKSEEEAKEYFNDLSTKLYASKDKRNEFVELLDEYGYVEDFEFEAISKTGKHLWFKMNARRGEKDKEGNFIIDGFTVDITDLKKVTEELRKEGIFLQQLTETSPIGITKVDENGDIIYANSAAEEILGLTKNLITNRTYDDPEWEITSLDGSPFPEEELPFYRVKKEGKTVYDVRHRIKDADGNIRTLSINATPVFNGKEFEGMVSTLLDISKQTRIESELKQSIEDKDMLMRELNHRVKNNLNMISSLINIKNSELQNTDLYDITAQIEAISIIHEKVQETGNLQCVELREYLQNLLESIFKSFGNRNVEIENNVDNIEIMTKDAMALGLIVNEVATNAIKYGFNDEEARFIVDLKEDGNYHKLYLTNTGNPFPKDVDIENVESLGMQLITALSSQLKGNFELIREPNTTFVISFLKE